jgi:hypothetical protein
MIRTIQGVIRGKTIEFTDEIDLPDGQPVEIIVRPARGNSSQPWGAGLERCAGAMADSWSEEDDRILQHLAEERTRDTRKELAE